MPISSPGCPWQWGYFEEEGAGPCSITYSDCAWGVPEQKYCQPYGLVYDDQIKGCNWPDEIGCKSEGKLCDQLSFCFFFNTNLFSRYPWIQMSRAGHTKSLLALS